MQYRFTINAREPHLKEEEISQVQLRLACLHHFELVVAARDMGGPSGSVTTLEITTISSRLLGRFVVGRRSTNSHGLRSRNKENGSRRNDQVVDGGIVLRLTAHQPGQICPGQSSLPAMNVIHKTLDHRKSIHQGNNPPYNLPYPQNSRPYPRLNLAFSLPSSSSLIVTSYVSPRRV